MTAKRLILATIFGTIAGVICGWASMSSVAEEIRSMVFVSSLLNRMFIGFLIGISAWKVHWALHGTVLGLVGSLPLAVPLLWNQDAGFEAFIMIAIAGIVWGFLIELLTSVVFKAKSV